MKLHIVYTVKGDTIPDKEIDEYVEKKIKRIKGTDQELQVNVANEIVVTAFRVQVKKGNINHNDILFYDKTTDEPIRINKNGDLENYPKGFCETNMDYLMELL